MKEKDKKRVLDAIENDGFDYAFNYYSTFSEIIDEEFHQLREEYLEASLALAKYVGYEC